MATARIRLAPAFLALIVLVSGPALGQSFRGKSDLQKVEDKLGGAAGAPPATAGAPGPGYLGGEFDDPRGTQKGVVVNSVKAGGPAEASGLKASDLITAIDGKAISNLNDLDAVLDKAVVGQKLRMTVIRVGRPTDITVTLGKKPAAPAVPPERSATEPPPLAPPGTLPAPRSPTLADPAPALGSPGPAAERPSPGGAFSPRSSFPAPAESAAPVTPPATTPAEPALGAGSDLRTRPLDLGLPPATSTPAETTPAPAESEPTVEHSAAGGPSLGITVDEPTDQARQTYGLTIRRGALITAVRAGSPADRAGLPVGGLVVRLDARPISSADDLVTAIRAARPGQDIELGYFEGAQFRRKSVTLGPSSAPAAPGSLPRAGGGMPVAPGGMSAGGGLLGHVERRVDNFVRGGVSGPSTVYDPSVMAALQDQVNELTATVKRLEERLKALEGGRGTSTPPAAPAPAITPGFGAAPIGPSTPGFVPGLGQGGSNP